MTGDGHWTTSCVHYSDLSCSYRHRLCLGVANGDLGSLLKTNNLKLTMYCKSIMSNVLNEPTMSNVLIVGSLSSSLDWP